MLDATNIVEVYQSIQYKESLITLTDEIAEESSSKMSPINFTKITSFFLKYKSFGNCNKIKQQISRTTAHMRVFT